VTEIGRGIATVVMFVGIGLIGTVSATVAAWFVTRREEPAAGELPEADPVSTDGATSEAEILARLDALAAQQDEIRAILQGLQRPTSGT